MTDPGGDGRDDEQIIAQQQNKTGDQETTPKESSSGQPATVEHSGEASGELSVSKPEEATQQQDIDGDVLKDIETLEDEVVAAIADKDKLNSSEEEMIDPEESNPAVKSLPMAREQADVNELFTEEGTTTANSSGKMGALSTESDVDGRGISVTTERKDELLLQARKSRNDWVAKIPMPYKKKAGFFEENNGHGSTTSCSDPWHEEERLSSLRSIRAAERIPTAMPILSMLYGLDNGVASPSQVADRIQTVLGSDMEKNVDDPDSNKVYPTAKEVLQAELASNDDDSYLKDYHAFWTQLQDPACATLVQGMRNFCRKLKDVTEKEDLMEKLKAYLEGSFRSLQTHPLWKKDGADERVRRALESFIYGQCYPQIETTLLLGVEAAEQKEKEWVGRLNDLQFVTPQHLEIACLSDDGLDLKELLKEPISALLSVRSYYSAYDKLQRILALYHGVNVALSTALNRSKQDEAPKKLPSADDVLPTIILTVLLANPDRLPFDLEIVEDFSTPEYLRGEAGYAFTNLYGAVHFLQDLDLKEPKTLSIGADEFRKGLEDCRARTEKRIRNSLSSSGEDADTGPQLESVNIPPIEVRLARLRGEKVDLDWATQWAEENLRTTASSTNNEESQTLDQQGGKIDDFMAGLPAGFNRNYSFLTTRPEDVKLGDLPKLLSEYRLLVHTTEVLLADRTEKDKCERKAKFASAQKDLLDRVRKVDPSLLNKK